MVQETGITVKERVSIPETGAVVRVAFQGELGAFGEEAVHAYFGEGATAVPMRSFAEVGAAVATGEIGYGVLPVENSIVGPVTVAVEVLDSSGLTVIGTVVRPIRLCLLTLPGTSLEEIRWILSHPVALGQCLRFRATLPAAEAVVTYDTAGAAKEVLEALDPRRAAVASHRAAARYGLEVSAEGIEDRPDNRTRFVVVARRG
jgi:prephenate dehydratase